MPTLIFTSAQDPTPRARLGENRPEERRSVILDRLRASSRAADIIAVEPNATALEKAKDLQCVTANKLSFLGSVHEAYRTDPSPDHSFASSETACGTGVVPYFFTRLAATERDPWPRRLAWHATDGLTPIFEDLPEVLAADAAVCERAAIFFDVESGKRGEELPAFLYVLPTHPGHHATAEHYGGYCFLNLAVFIDALLRERGFSPFIIDVDYHAGDGTASFLGASGRFVSLHVRASLRPPFANCTQCPIYPCVQPMATRAAAVTPGLEASSQVPCVPVLETLHCVQALDDYPFLPVEAATAPTWAVGVPPDATWLEYEPLLRAALRRRPEASDSIIISLGFDTLAGDPDAKEGCRMSLQPADFGRMRSVVSEEVGHLPIIAVQEGGYNLQDIPAAAEAFCVG